MELKLHKVRKAENSIFVFSSKLNKEIEIRFDEIEAPGCVYWTKWNKWKKGRRG